MVGVLLFGYCGWLCHGPYCLCVFIVCVYLGNDVFRYLVYLRRGKVMGGRNIMEEVRSGFLSLLGVLVSHVVKVE